MKSYALFRDPQGRITAKESSAKSALWLQKWLVRQRAAAATHRTTVRFVVHADHLWWDAGYFLPEDVTPYGALLNLDDAMAAAKARLNGALLPSTSHVDCDCVSCRPWTS